MSIKISSTSSNNSNGELHPNDHYYATLVSNLTLNGIVAAQRAKGGGTGSDGGGGSGDAGGASTTTMTTTATTNNAQLVNRDIDPFLFNKSKFKTIKIFVASNKNEFSNELECLHREVLPELQQYFMQFGYDFSFVDYNFNFDFDTSLDPYLFDCMLKELEECFRVSDGCFFLALIGNKYGSTPLPVELNATQYETIRSLSTSSDFEFFKSHYVFDDMTKLYKFKPLVNTFKNIYNIQPDSEESRKSDIRGLKELNDRLLDILLQLASNEQKRGGGGGGSNDGKQSNGGSLNSIRPKQPSSLIGDRINYSGLELLTHTALRHSPNECFTFNRILENVDPAKKSSEKFVDLQTNGTSGSLLGGGKLDKQKEERQAKFRESAALQKLLSDENRYEMKLKWKEKYDEEVSNMDNDSSGVIIKKATPPATLRQAEQQLSAAALADMAIDPISQANTTDALNEKHSGELTNGGATSSNKFLDKFESEYKTYLEQFISVIVEKLKHLINKSVRAFDAACDCRFNWHEMALLQEITRHVHRFETCSAFGLASLDSDEYCERFKRLLHAGSRADHWPVFIYGLPCTGKQFLLTRFASIALTLYPNSLSLIRYFELTGQCSTFEGLVFSLCEQLSVLDAAPKTPAHTPLGTAAALADTPLPPPSSSQQSAYQQLKSKDLAALVEYFYKQCKQLSEKHPQVPLFIFIDGLHDMNAERSMLSKTTVVNNQIAWMFAHKLPPNVHLIVSVKRQLLTSVRTGFEAMNELNATSATTNTTATTNTGSSTGLGPPGHMTGPGNSIIKRPSTTSTTQAATASSYVPIFLYYHNEHVINDSSSTSSPTPSAAAAANGTSTSPTGSSSSPAMTDNCMFEMPIQVRKLDLTEFSASIRTQTAVNRQFAGSVSSSSSHISDEYLRSILQSLLANQSNMGGGLIDGLTMNPSNNATNNNGSSSSSSSSSSANTCYYYLNFLIRDLLMCGKFIAPSSDSFPKDIETYIKCRIDAIEKRFNAKMLSIIFNYISASHNGVTEMELIDLLSCNNDFFTEFYTDSNLPLVLRFPITYWILLKFHLGNFLSKKYVDCKITFYWTNDTIKKLMKQRYLNKVDQIRQSHKDMANYFLESFIESKPLVDMNRNLHLRDEEGRRFISQQPLVYSETKYNYRRMSELWFHLMNSGDIQRLKEHAFYNFEHLLAKCHGVSLQVLLNDIDTVLRRILDVDILLMSSFLRKSIHILVADPLRLAAEILARLRPLEDEYGEHVTLLVNQVLTWCDQHDSPLLVPYTTWADTPESLLISKIEHNEGILKLAVTSFNQHVFFSNAKNEICMYHIPSKKMVRRFSGHSDLITFLIISHNNRYLISGSSDKLIKVWNLGNGEMENTFNNHKSSILCGILTNSDEFLITGTYDRLINVTRVENGDIVYSSEKHFDSVTSLAISLDDKILISASLDKSIKRWSFPDMELVDTISTIYSPITSMTITCDNTFILIACENHSVQVKSLITGADVHELVGSSGPAVNALVTSRDGERVYIGCADSKLYLYDIKTRQLIAVLAEQEAPIYDLCLSSDSSFLFSSSGNTLYVLNMKKKKFTKPSGSVERIKSGSSHHYIVPNSGPGSDGSHRLVRAVAMSKDGEMAITGDNLGQVNLWNLVRGELIETIIDDVGNSSMNEDGVSLNQAAGAAGGGGGTGGGGGGTGGGGTGAGGGAGHATTGQKGQTGGAAGAGGPGLGAGIGALAGGSGGSGGTGAGTAGGVVATTTAGAAAGGGQANAATAQGHSSLSSNNTIGVCQVALFNSHLFSLIAFTDHTVSVYDNEIGDVVAVFDEHQHPVKYIHILEDTRKVFTSDGRNSCKIWVAHSGQLLETITVACGIIGLSPDAKYVVSGPGENSVKIWTLSDAHVIRNIDHPERITTMAFTPDSTYVITGGEDASCKIWELATGKLIQVLIEHEAAITSIAAPLNNAFVVSGSRDKLVLVWNFKDGSVLHKLSSHTDAIVRVAITQDASIVVSGSRDGLICVWSSHHGNLLSSLPLQHSLGDLIVALDGSHIVARLDDTDIMPIIGLTKKWPKELAMTRTLSSSSLRSFEQFNKGMIKRLNRYHMILPIKPKPLMIKKKLTNLSTFFNEDSKLKEFIRVSRKESEPNALNIGQNENSISTPQHSFSRGNAVGGPLTGDKIKTQTKRKVKKPAESANSATSTTPNQQRGKQRKTKICCLL